MTKVKTAFAMAMAAFVGAGIALSIPKAEAGWLDSMTTSNWETISANKYKVDVHGFDVRAYTFKPVGAEHKSCVMVFSGKGPVGLSCSVDPNEVRAAAK